MNQNEIYGIFLLPFLLAAHHQEAIGFLYQDFEGDEDEVGEEQIIEDEENETEN